MVLGLQGQRSKLELGLGTTVRRGSNSMSALHLREISLVADL